MQHITNYINYILYITEQTLRQLDTHLIDFGNKMSISISAGDISMLRAKQYKQRVQCGIRFLFRWANRHEFVRRLSKALY